ncbi:hypothetical protein GC194_08105 [bacterium]|nr:hypothetical protein [bacterium]
MCNAAQLGFCWWRKVGRCQSRQLSVVSFQSTVISYQLSVISSQWTGLGKMDFGQLNSFLAGSK